MQLPIKFAISNATVNNHRMFFSYSVTLRVLSYVSGFNYVGLTKKQVNMLKKPFNTMNLTIQTESRVEMNISQNTMDKKSTFSKWEMSNVLIKWKHNWYQTYGQEFDNVMYHCILIILHWQYCNGKQKKTAIDLSRVFLALRHWKNGRVLIIFKGTV